MISKSNENSNGNFKLPPGFDEIVKIGDKVLLVDRYTITIALLSVLASISSGVRYSLRKNGSDEDAIVIYVASFQPTGIGKSSAITFFRKNILMLLVGQKKHDIMIDDASSEGLEESLLAGSSPHIFLDEFGKYLQSAKKESK